MGFSLALNVIMFGCIVILLAHVSKAHKELVRCMRFSSVMIDFTVDITGKSAQELCKDVEEFARKKMEE